MTNYNINILKQNILKLMNEKGITQSALAKGIGMQQSRISKILNLDNSDCFTVQQLADIAGFPPSGPASSFNKPNIGFRNTGSP